MATQQFMALLQFSREDLEYNRQGMLSPRQKAEQNRGDGRYRLYSGVVLLLAVGFIVVTIINGEGSDLSMLIPAGIVAVFAFIIFASVTFNKLEKLDIRTVQGEARTQFDRDDGRRHIVIIDKVDFSVPREIFDIIEEGERYGIYYIDFSGHRQILSMEKL